MAHLFSPFQLRGIEFPNRIFLSPMCQYSSRDGHPSDWHLVHLGSRAVGGAGLVMMEASAVSPEGRITPFDMGIWSDDHADSLQRITQFIRQYGSIPGIQLAHAGRKASTQRPWEGGRPLGSEQGGWRPIAPSAIAYSSDFPVPQALSIIGMRSLLESFTWAAERALRAGFQVLELHMAHGYLLHEFLSPIANRREDDYGGSFENRCRFPLEVVRSVRAAWPDELPIFVRISATDWSDDGWDLEESIKLARELKKLGVDLIDCSSGGIAPHIEIPQEPGFQVPFAARIREEAHIATGAVGMITEATQAEELLKEGSADAVLLGRALLRNPYWAKQAATELAVDVAWPKPYERIRTHKSPNSISLADLRALFFGEEPFTVIDVRSISEFCDGHIEGALRIPYEELLSFVSSLPKDSNFITVSNGGTGRSRSAADLLRSHGWFNARRLEGGYYQWSAAGLPSIESGLLAS